MNRQAWIINADDFGLTESCTRAIAEAFHRGLISSTTACANGEAIEAAYQIAAENGFLDCVGIHINLTEGTPLTEGMKTDPFFCENGIFHGRINRLKKPSKQTLAHLEAEVAAQIERLKAIGFPISHADSHHHIHTGLYLIGTIETVLKRYGIEKIRIHRNLGSIRFYKKIVKNRFNKSLQKRGFITTQKMGSFADLQAMPEIAKAYLTEIMVHPDFDRNGVLIDRIDKLDGDPVGKPLDELKPYLQNETLISYGDL